MTVIYVINQYAQYESRGVVRCCEPLRANGVLILFD